MSYSFVLLSYCCNDTLMPDKCAQRPHMAISNTRQREKEKIIQVAIDTNEVYN